MIETNDNLVAVAYKTGFCGSLMYYLLAHSPEVAKYQQLTESTFPNGTSHDNQEIWFNDLHDYQDSLTVAEDRWPQYQTNRGKAAMASDQLVVFRCHPNTAFKLDFLKNLKVLYMTHSNALLCERWAYEKVYKPLGEEHYKQNFRQLFKTNKVPEQISNTLKRQFIINNLRHDIRTFNECKQLYQDKIFQVKLEQLLGQDYAHYVEVSSFLKITPIEQQQFEYIIQHYNSKQWKRF
jgi:hypothetical protein